MTMDLIYLYHLKSLNYKILGTMTTNCPKCGKVVSYTISDSIDESGETYKCRHCGWKFRYVER